MTLTNEAARGFFAKLASLDNADKTFGFNGSLEIDGSLTVNTNFIVKGTFTFGDAATDSLTVTGYQANTYSGTAQDAVSITASGALAAGKNGLKITVSNAGYSSTSHGIHVLMSGAGTAGAYGVYINASGTNVEALKVDAGVAVFDETVTCTGGYIMDGAVTTGISVTGATTTGISITGNATTAISIGTGTFTTAISATGTLASQTLENKFADVIFSTDSTYITGTNITYSGARGSSNLKLTTTWTGASGGCHGIYSLLTASTNFASDNDGAINIKAVTVSTDVAVTDGSLYGGQFIAKKAGHSVATAQAAFIGLEGWFMETGTGEVRTGIGGNFGYHADSAAASHAAGSVWRGVQIFCDNGGTSNAEESTGLCIWNQAGAIDNAINITQSASGFTNLIYSSGSAACIGNTRASPNSTAICDGSLVVKIGTKTLLIPLYNAVTIV